MLLRYRIQNADIQAVTGPVTHPEYVVIGDRAPARPATGRELARAGKRVTRCSGRILSASDCRVRNTL
jgi:hypothetical protein